MKREIRIAAVLGWGLACSLFASGQETGLWRASSKTARSITGDVALSQDRMAINFARFTIAQIRRLKPAEVSAVFDADSSAAAAGNLYRTDIPGATKFLHKNTLCGGEDVQWVAAYAVGKDLQLAFFSGADIPVFTREAISNSTNLCGTYAYGR